MLIQTKSGILLSGNNNLSVAGALLLPQIWPRITFISEEGCSGKNTKEASNAQKYEFLSFPGLDNTLETRVYLLLKEIFVENTGRELLSLQPSILLPSQYFMMPSQGGVVGSLQGDEGGQQALNSVNDCRKWFVSLEVVPAQSQCPSQK